MPFITKLLTCPIAMGSFIALVSLGALGAALTSEVVLGLEPCMLCIYQRAPYAFAIVLGLIILIFRKNTRIVAGTILLSGLAFLINSGIALYHSGVEQKWWRSAVEGCAVPSFGDEPQSILENILSAPTARCDEIPWADPILSLSMANYNVALCFGLFMVCVISFVLIKRRPSHS